MYPLTVKLQEQPQYFTEVMRKLEHLPYTIRNRNVLMFFSPFTGEEIVVTLPFTPSREEKLTYTVPIRDKELLCRIVSGAFIANVGDSQIPVPMKFVEYPYDYLFSNGLRLLKYLPYQTRDLLHGKRYLPSNVVMTCPEDGCRTEIEIDLDPAKLEGKFVCPSCFTKFQLVANTLVNNGSTR